LEVYDKTALIQISPYYARAYNKVYLFEDIIKCNVIEVYYKSKSNIMVDIPTKYPTKHMLYKVVKIVKRTAVEPPYEYIILQIYCSDDLLYDEDIKKEA
jgi:hypothetical protein